MTKFKQTKLEELSENIVIHTNKGDIKICLFEEEAPKTVKNFVELARSNYYDKVIFHRIIKDFMIQGGDPTGTGRGGESIYGESFEDEFSPHLFNLFGSLSMANAGPNTNGSQFFIVTANQVPENMLNEMKSVGYPDEIIKVYQEKGGTPWLDHRHSVFGHVIDGMDTVLAIQEVETNQSDKPIDDVFIEKITILD